MLEKMKMENEKTAFELSEKGEFAKASELWEELGQKNPSYYYRAADNAERAGDIERAINLYERIGSSLDIEHAVSLALRAGMVERAVKSGEKRVLLENSICGAIRKGWTADFDAIDYIIGVARTHEMYDSAIDVAKKYGKPETIPITYLRAAAKARDRKEFEKAAELAEKAGNFRFAALNAKDAGLADRAIGLLERSGEFYKAAEIAFDAGMIDRAKQLYERGFAQDREEISQVLTLVRNEDKSGHFSGDLSLEPLVCKLGLAERVPKEAGMTEIVQQMESIQEDAYAIHRKYPYPKMFWGIP